MFSCSVKEDRLSCPCCLSHRIDGGPYSGDVIFTLLENGRGIRQQTMDLNLFNAPSTVFSIPRAFITDCVAGGVNKMRIECDSLIVIPTGNDCDPIRASSVKVAAFEDEVIVETALRKLYADVELIILNAADHNFTLDVRIRSDVRGFSMCGLRPLEGEFLFNPERLSVGADACYRFRLPRQKDDSLTLELLSGESVAASIGLGGYIRRIGYDWNAPSLPEEVISVVVDYSNATIVLKIADWETGGMFDITI